MKIEPSATRWPYGMLAILGASLLGLAAPLAWANPVDPNRAAAAVRGWLKADAHPFGELLGHAVQRVETFGQATGKADYYIVYLEPSGFVVVAAEDLVEPIVAFAAHGRFDPSPTNPLGAMVSRDLAGRVSRARQIPAGAALEHSAAQARSKWLLLEAADKDGGGIPKRDSLVSEVRVAPFVKSLWSQQNAGGSGSAALYNYYTPPYGDGNNQNYPAGCVATALGQLMRYYQYPTTGVGMGIFTVYVNNAPWSYTLHGGDGAGGPYVWSNMPLVPSSTPSSAQCQAIGALIADAGATVNMEYSSSGSSSVLMDGVTALTGTFHYGNAIKGYNYNANLDLASSLSPMMNPNLDARFPVLLGIQGPAGGHAVVADGYGYSGSTLYHHLNLGWQGTDNAWYALPTIDTSNGLFNVVDSCVYNVFTNGTGEIISGRVLDQISRPVASATVTATLTGGGTYTAVTDTNGIYALVKVPRNSSYSLSVTKANFGTNTSSCFTGTSANLSATSGNYWGANLMLEMLPTAVDHLDWSTLAATQLVSTPIAVTITARNATNGVATGFNGTVALSAASTGVGPAATLIPSFSGYSYTYSSAGMTLGYAFTPSTNLLVTHVRLYSGDKVSIWSNDGTLLASQSASASSGWVETALPAPITLLAGTTYRVSTHCASNAWGFYTSSSWPSSFGNGTIESTFYYSYGDAFPTQVYATGAGPLVDLRYRVILNSIIPVTPTVSGSFVNGIWNGNLSISQTGTNVTFKADDAAGHLSYSTAFNVIDPEALPPSIVSQPQSQTNNAGDTASFNVAVLSRAACTYTWRRNGNPVSGATSSSYSLLNVQLADSGSQFTCAITNQYGGVTSTSAILTVTCTNVTVALQPAITLNSGGEVYAVAPLPDGSVIFGGYFTNVNGFPRYGLAKLASDGTLDQSWVAQVNGGVLALVASGTNLFVGGGFTSIGGITRNYIAKLSASGTGAVDPAWNPAPDYTVWALAVTSSNLYAAGEFWTMGPQSRHCLAKLNTESGEVDPAWDPDATTTGLVEAIALNDTNLYIGGSFTTIRGLPRNNLARLNLTGTGAPDPTWIPNANSEIHALAASGNDVFAGGSFTVAGGQSRRYLAKLSATGNGAADATWNPNPDYTVWSLSDRGLSLYAGGNFTNIGTFRRIGLAKLSITGAGAADPSWQADCNNTVYSLLAADSDLHVGGAFTTVAGAAHSGIAKLTYTPTAILPARVLAGQLQSGVSGERGQRYEVQASTNLVNWQALCLLTNTTGVTNFIDSATSLPRRFYRARLLP